MGNRRTAIVVVVVGMIAMVAACRRTPEGLSLTAPGDEARLGTVSASWQPTEEERGFANAARLDEPEVRFRYRVDVHNGEGEKLFVRLERFELVDDGGHAVAAADASIECTLGAGTTEAVLAGDIWVRKRNAERVRDFRIRRFAAALDDEGRTHYRSWLLAGRPGDEAAVDREITRQAALPACGR